MIKVVGIGGCGCNVISRMMKHKAVGIEYTAMDTDRESLSKCTCDQQVLLGERVARGLGTAGDVELGRRAAEESGAVLSEAVSGADLIVLVCGLGGGTGTGALPAVVKAARLANAPLICLAHTPYAHEGKRKRENAAMGLRQIKKDMSAFMIVDNDGALRMASASTPIWEMFEMLDRDFIALVNALGMMLDGSSVIAPRKQEIKRCFQYGGRLSVSTAKGSSQEIVGKVSADMAKEGMSGDVHAVFVHIVDESGQMDIMYDDIVDAVYVSLPASARVYMSVCQDKSAENNVCVTRITCHV